MPILLISGWFQHIEKNKSLEKIILKYQDKDLKSNKNLKSSHAQGFLTHPSHIPLTSPHIWNKFCCHIRCFGKKQPPTFSLKLFKKRMIHPIVDGGNPAPVEVGSLSHYFQGFIHPKWLALGFLNHQQYGHLASPRWSLLGHIASNISPLRYNQAFGKGSRIHTFTVGFLSFLGFRWATKKTLRYFPLSHPGCLIGILIMAYHSPHITR